MESGSVRRKLEGPRTSNSDLKTRASLVIFLLLASARLSEEECPSVCECKWKSGKESVLCAKGRLKAIPNGLDPGTQVLDMSYNLMEKLPTRIFLSLNLLNLQKIFLSECQLVSLEGDSFAKLTNLIELDLSGNRLEFIPSHTFSSIPELRELKVSSNPISRLSNDAFVALPRLVRLELTACRLETIETWAFRGLPDLEWLRLDNNRLLTVQAESFYPLRNLHGLEVAENPWNCTCVLQPLRDWMGKNNVPFGIPPTCSTPKRIAGKSWDKLQLEDFACLPKLTSSTDQERISRVVEGENGTLLCRFRATPDTQVRWLSGNKGSVVTNGSVGSSSASTFVLTESFVWTSSEDTGSPEEGRSGDKSLGIKISKLTVIRTTPREAGLYVCRAESKAGFVLANFTLLVLQTRAEGLTGRLLFTGALVAALLILVVCLLLLCVVLGSRRVRTSSRVLTEAEKIELNHLDLDHVRQNGGGTVPLIEANDGGEGNGPIMNNVGHGHIHGHSLGHSNNTLNSGGSALSHSLNNVMMLRKSVGGQGVGGGSREHNDYKALPTVDADEKDMNMDKEHEHKHERDHCIARGDGSEEETSFLITNLNANKRHSTSKSVHSPNSQSQKMRGGQDHIHAHVVSSPHKEQSQQHSHQPHQQRHFASEQSAGSGGYHQQSQQQQQRDVFPDLLNEKMPSIPLASDFTSLPRTINRNHDPEKSGSYFHRRINSESQSPLLSNSFGVSLEKVSTGPSGLELNFIGGGSAGNSSLSMSSACAGGGQTLSRSIQQQQQRLSMPTSPIHERDVLSYDYHAAQLAAFLEEYRLLQLELMRMSASLNHVDQPVLPNNVNASSSSSTGCSSSSRQPVTANDNKPPYIPPRQCQLPPNTFFRSESPRSQLHLNQQQRHLLQSRTGGPNNVIGLGQGQLPLQHNQQLKSILKNPSTTNNNNYMA